MIAQRVIVQAVQVTVAVAVVLLLILWMAGVFTAKVAPGSRAVPAATAPEGAPTAQVEAVVVPVIEEAAGTVQAERKTVVSSRIVATITEVRVSAGDAVQAGDTLILLDARELSAKAREARRAEQAAAAARQRAESDFARVARLLKDGVISQSEFDQAESAFKIADAELEQARQAVQAADIALTYAEIKSPVDGRVIDRLADPGDTALPGTPLLSLYDPSALRIEVPVREALLNRLALGDTVPVRLGVGGETVEGRVDEIVPQAEAGSRTFLVKIGLPKREGVYTGMFGRALIPAGERRRLLVPLPAVRQIGQLEFAEVVEDARRLSRRLLTLGPVTGDGRVEVLSGLREGETVLLEAGGTAGEERDR